MVTESSQSGQQRQRRYRLHKSGIHDECLPDRGCRKNGPPPPLTERAQLSPRDALQREFVRVVARLDVLHAAVEERPTDVELSAEQRGLQRVLVALTSALGKLAPPAPVVPLKENPLQALRRDVEERRAAASLEELRRRRAEQRSRAAVTPPLPESTGSS